MAIHPDEIPARNHHDLPAKLAAICGAEHVLTGDAAHAFAVEGSIPQAAVFPGHRDEVAALLKLAHNEDLAVVPRGGGTQMGLGDLPTKVDLVIGLRRLNRIIAHEPADMTVTVEAGATLAEIQLALEQANQFVPLDPPLSSATTIGGCLATRASGPQRLAYGTLRDRLLGITVIQAGGETIKAGGRVVKNVSGYELGKLYTGSLGTLGLIVEATLKVQPLPAHRGALLVEATPLERAENLLQALMDAPLEPAFLELVGPLGPAGLLPLDPGQGPDSGPGPRFALAVGFAGTDPEVEWQLTTAAAQMAALTPPVRTLTGSWPEVHGTLLDTHRYGWPDLADTNAGGHRIPGTLTARASLLSSQVTGFAQAVDALAAEHGLVWQFTAHAGTGIARVHLRATGNDAEGATDKLAETARRLRAWCRSHQGAFILEAAPAAIKSEVSVWGEPGGDFFLMEAIKHKLDARGIMNPGRFLGGL